MCQGYFRKGRPYVKAAILSPKIRAKRPSWSEFIVDTGADRTILGYPDALKLGIDTSKLKKIKVSGVGGIANACILKNVGLLFLDEDKKRRNKSLHLEPLDEIIILPTLRENLLGRDLMNLFSVSKDFYNRKIELKRNDYAGRFHLTMSA